jgi:hypothetical protein
MPGKVINTHKSVKHEIIDRTNSKMLVAVGIATFLFVFSVFACRALISQSLYHGRVIREKELALRLLKDNEKTVAELKQSFDEFQSQEKNILGGNPTGSGELDGSNAKLVLDALPSKYDFPALSSSIEKILRDGGFEIGSIGGIEDSALAESSNTASGTVAPVEMPYMFTVNADTDGIKRLLDTLERSIRPIYVDLIQVQSGDTVLQAQITLRTFFTQPKTFQLGSQEVQ